MLGQLQCIPRTASSRSILIPSEDSVGDTTAFSNNAQVTALRPPCKIVIGFDVESEKKELARLCDSPRSVLESPAALSSQARQQPVARSPLSGLGNLLAVKTRSDEDVDIMPLSPEAAKVSTPHSFKCSVDSGGRIPRSASTILPKNVQCKLSDPVCANHGQGLHPASQNDLQKEILDAKISLLLVAEGSSSLSNEDSKGHLDTSLPSQTSSCLLRSSMEIDKKLTSSLTEGTQGHEDRKSNTNLSTFAHAEFFLMETTKQDMVPDWNSFMSSVRNGSFNAKAPPGNACHHAETDIGYDSHQSIFLASSPYFSRSLAMNSSGFLKVCNYCGCFLSLGKDIFMYRGDQTFCSAECRDQKIFLDDRRRT